MKKKGHTDVYKNELLADLMQNYRALRREHYDRYGHINMRQLSTDLVHRPAKRFYISVEHAARIITQIEKGDVYHSSRSPSLKEMYYEIYARYKSYQRHHPDTGKYIIIENILATPAPRFYMEPHTAENIICKLLIEKRKNGRSGRP